MKLLSSGDALKSFKHAIVGAGLAALVFASPALAQTTEKMTLRQAVTLDRKSVV